MKLVKMPWWNLFAIFNPVSIMESVGFLNKTLGSTLPASIAYTFSCIAIPSKYEKVKDMVMMLVYINS